MKNEVIVKIRVKNEDTFDMKRAGSTCENEPEDTDFEEEDIFDESDDVDTNDTAKAFPEEGIEIVTEGSIMKNGTRLVLRYLETDASDLEREQTSISFELSQPEIVTMERNGICKTAMVFEPGRRYISIYDVGGMVLELVVRTFELENNLCEEGGTLMLGYALDNGGVTVSRVKMNIEVRLK